MTYHTLILLFCSGVYENGLWCHSLVSHHPSDGMRWIQKFNVIFKYLAGFKAPLGNVRLSERY